MSYRCLLRGLFEVKVDVQKGDLGYFFILN